MALRSATDKPHFRKWFVKTPPMKKAPWAKPKSPEFKSLQDNQLL
jgi:hypothetical protein